MPLLLLILSWIPLAALSGMFLTLYVQVSGAPVGAIATHLAVLAQAALFVLGLRLFLTAWLGTGRLVAVAGASVSVPAVMLLGLFYLATIVGLRTWNRVPSVEMMAAYVAHSPDLAQALGISLWMVLSLVVAVFVLSWWITYHQILRNDWAARWTPAVLSRKVAMLCGTASMSIAAILLAEFPYRDWGLESEPISLAAYPLRGAAIAQNHAMSQFRMAHLDALEANDKTRFKPATLAHRSNIVVIVVDALRADRMSLLGYSRPTTPLLEKFVQRSKRAIVANMVAVCSESSCGLKALAASRYLDRQPSAPFTLGEVLRRHGYRSHFVLSGDHANFYGLRSAYGEADSFFDGSLQTAYYLNDDQLVLHQLQNAAPWDGVPVYLQIHLMSAHPLGRRMPGFDRFGPSANYTRLVINPDTADEKSKQTASNYYDRGILQTDHFIHNILEVLEAKGYLKNTLVLVTGDHGEAMGEHGEYGHSRGVWEESLRVPLILIALGAAPTLDIKLPPVVSQVDIAPTLLRSLGITPPVLWEGQALQSQPSGRLVHFQQGNLLGVYDTRTPEKIYKHWRNVVTGEMFTFELRGDPHEREDVSSLISAARKSEWQAVIHERAAAAGNGPDENRW